MELPEPKRRGSIPRTCEYCGRTFYTCQYHINKGWARFCCLTCKGAHQKDMVKARPCEVCGTPFRPRPTQLARGWGRFCSVKCKGAGHIRDHANQFWQMVRKTDTCWVWAGYTDDSGYGQFGIAGNKDRAHRIAYQLTYGPIPDGCLIRHTCDNPPCCRPDHLIPGTYADNADDAVKRCRRPTKLTEAQVQSIRAQYIPGVVGTPRLAKIFGVNRGVIQAVVSGKTWRHLLVETTSDNASSDRPDPKQEHQPWTPKLTAEQVLAIRAEYRPNVVGAERLAKRYNVTKATVQRIIKRLSWAHI